MMRSIQQHNLEITGTIVTQADRPSSPDESFVDETGDTDDELRVAFGFDGGRPS